MDLQRRLRFGRLGGLLACAAWAAGARAQDSMRIDVELSHDEFAWSSQLAFAPGNTIHVRVRVTHEGTQTVLGFANVLFQPTISPWPSGSILLPFTNPTSGVGVPDAPGLRGRVLPFDSPSMSTSSNAGALTGFVDPGSILRIAGANSTGLANVARGISCSQVPVVLSTNFNPNTSVVVFKAAVQISDQAPAAEYVFDLPIAGISNSRAVWYITPVGATSHIHPLTSADIHPARAYIGGNPCIFAPVFSSQPVPIERASGQTAAFDAVVNLGICQPASVRWYLGNTPLSDGSRITGATTTHLRIGELALSDAGAYRLLASNTVGSTWSNPATLQVRCTADFDDGTGTGTRDGGVTIDDLLYFLGLYAGGLPNADLDDGTGTGTPDNGVTIDDLLYFLSRFLAGC